MLKKYSLAKVLVVSLALLWAAPSFAQISQGGLPPSFTQSSSKRAKAKAQAVGFERKVDVPFDVDALKREDLTEAAMNQPPRVAEIIPVDYTMENSGEWTTLASGERIWRLGINAPNAIAQILYYKQFYLPQGARLFIYSANERHVLGAYTSENNPQHGPEFATEMVAGDALVLEYVAPTGSESNANSYMSTQPVISISGIGYVYNDSYVQLAEAFFDVPMGPSHAGSSGACMVNINCSEGGAWQNQKRGVASTIQAVGSSSYLCSGTIVNNTEKNMIPYFLMAFHCSHGNGIVASDADINKWIFYFNFERTGCSNSSPLATYKTMTGAQRLVSLDINGSSDGLLLRLNASIPKDYNVYYNGWDRRNTPALSGVSIHHPKGDVKKISTFDGGVSSGTWLGNTGSVGATNAHWAFQFVGTANGWSVTEGGSSGSPMFDQNGRVVGTLSGGTSSCAATTGRNLYGKLWYHWDQAPDPNQHMAKYLDPINTGAEYLDGMYPGDTVMVGIIASDTLIYASNSIVYTDGSMYAGTWKWTFEGGVPSSYIGKTPPPVVYNNTGVYKTTLLINEGNIYQRSASRYVKVIQKEMLCPNSVTIGSGTATSEFPLGANQKYTYSSALYTAAELNMSAGGVINGISWYADSATSINRAIYIYLKEVDTTAQKSTTWANEVDGATLVYQAAPAWKNVKGEVKIPFVTDFTYSGTKNLKVLVRIVTSVEVGFVSSKCFYSNVPKSHQQWTATGTTTTGNGTVNGNRPNIKLYTSTPCGAVEPVADFLVKGNGIFGENFDETPNALFPPKGWTVENVGTGISSNKWIAASTGKSSTWGSYLNIDPSNKYSAYVNFDTAAPVNTWLKSPKMHIDRAGTLIDFYLFYGGTYLKGGSTTFYVSVDSGASWVPKWSTGDVDNPSLLHKWWLQSIDLSEYVGRNVRFAWQYYGRGGDVALLDGILVYVPSDTAEVYEGESASFVDKSSGPPVFWDWTFTGGNISSSTLSSPSVLYAKAGVYDATLTVRSNLGTSTKTVKGAVVVKSRVPKPGMLVYADAFSTGGNGHNKFDGGQSLPPEGGKVSFDETSTYFPTSRQWYFPGAKPESSNKVSVKNVLYPESSSASYDVILHSTNSAGTGADTVKKAVQVGGTAEVWNVYGFETPTSEYRINGITYLTAIPSSYFSKISERFEFTGAGMVSKVKFYSTPSSYTQGCTLKVAICEDVNGLPGTEIDSAYVPFPVGYAAQYVTVTFPKPIPVQGAYHVVFSHVSGGGTRRIPQTAARAFAYNTIYGYYMDTRWVPISDLGIYGSLNVTTEYTYTTFTLETADTFKVSNIQANPETISFASSDSVWKASSRSWVRLSAASGRVVDGQASLSFTCEENTTSQVRVDTITVRSGGTKARITVIQAGTTPVKVASKYDDVAHAAKLTWILYDKIPPSVDMADSIEGHTSFTINSPGSVGWSYIDGDGGQTYSIKGDTFPHQNEKMAFIVFDPTATTPPMTGTLLDTWKGHSGYKSLACFGAATNKPNNDWLISPQLNFLTSFTFSFWAKAVNLANADEHFKVYYSIRGKKQSDFTELVADVPKNKLVWTKYSYTIPPEATFVAIQCLSNDKFALLIDDLFIGTGAAPSPMSEPQSAPNSTLSAKLTPGNAMLPASSWERIAAAATTQSTLRSTPQAAAGEEAVLRWDNGTNYSAIGTANGGAIEVAVLFSPEDQKKFATSTITAVEIFPAKKAKSMMLHIRNGNDIVYSQPISGLTYGQFNRVELDEEVPIDAEKNLMVGYSFVQYAGTGNYAAGCDAGPGTTGKSDLIALPGEDFQSLSAVSSISINWNIAVIMKKGDPTVTYKVYRDGMLIASELEEMEYVDTDLPEASNVCYEISAVYKGDSLLESTLSALSCMYAKSVITITADSYVKRELELNPRFTGRVTGGDLLPGDSEHDIMSRVHYSSTNSPISPVGTYAITPVLDSLNKVQAYTAKYAFVAANGTLTISSPHGESDTLDTKITKQPQGTSLCTGGTYTMDISAMGIDVSYQWQRYKGEGSWVNVGAPITGSGTRTSVSYTFANVTVDDAALYRVQVSGRSSKQISDTVPLRVGIPLQDIADMKWGNVPSVNCNVETNGGYDFEKFQWYKNGEPIDGATKPYLKVPEGSTDSYRCEMDTKVQEIPLSICDFVPVQQPAALSIYPSPVPSGGTLSLTSVHALDGAEAAIYSESGMQVKAGMALQGSSATISVGPLKRGVYILRITTAEGVQQTVKFAVE